MIIHQTRSAGNWYGMISHNFSVVNLPRIENLYWPFMFRAVAFSEEPLCLSQRPKGNIILMLSHHKTCIAQKHKNRICLKVRFMELEVKCSSWATRGMKKSLGFCWRETGWVSRLHFHKSAPCLSKGRFIFFLHKEALIIFLLEECMCNIIQAQLIKSIHNLWAQFSENKRKIYLYGS